MRILDGAAIVHMAVLLILMLSLLFLNVAVYANRVSKRVNWQLHIASFFLLCLLALQFLIESIMGMEIEKGFVIARNFLLIPTAVFAGILLWSVLRQDRREREFELNPHFENLFAEMDDTVAIFDSEGRTVRIQDKNGYLDFLKEPLEDLSQLTVLFPGGVSRELKQPCTFEIADPQTNSARQVLLSPITSETGRLLGYSAVIHDISDYHRLFSILSEKNTCLKDANEKLLHEVEVLELLESQKQRLKLITKIQEELVVRIEKTIGSIESVEKRIQSGKQPDREELMILSEELNLIYKEVRSVVRTISAKGEPVID